MTKESMTIAALIAESKKITKKMESIINDNNFSIINYYFDFNKFIGAQTVEQKEELIKADFDKFCALQARLEAVNTARIKANSETYVEVPELLDIKQILAKKVASTEKVTIANAILRKKYYVDLLKLANAIIYKYNLDVQKKQKFDEQSMIAIEQELDRKFPADSKRAYSADDVDKAREKARKANEVIVSDPIGLVGTNALTEYAAQLADYISTIDTILSVANASTVVEFEY